MKKKRMCADVSYLHQTRHGSVDHDKGEKLHSPVKRDANNLEAAIEKDTIKDGAILDNTI